MRKPKARLRRASVGANVSDRSRPPCQTTGMFMSASAGGTAQRIVCDANTELGRFHIRKHLGQGSLADVYLAHDTACGQDVAIKVVLVAPGDTVAPARLQRERVLCGMIRDYSHVVRVYDIHPLQLGGADFLILSMEHADGGSLRDWLRGHRDDWRNRRVQVLDCFRQICEGVRVIHDCGLVRLDLKPENVLQVGSVWKISDFSASSAMLGGLMMEPSVSIWVADEVERGTPVYSSPEQFRGVRRGELDARTDIYSLGIILYEILHPDCQPPFVGSSAQLHNLHTTALPPSLPGASATEARVVGRCLCKDPAERYQSVSELLDDLDDRSNRSEATRADREQSAAMWRNACRCMEEGRFDCAQRTCRQLLNCCPDHAEAGVMLEELRTREKLAAELYATMEQSLDQRSLEELCSLLNEAVSAFPEHPAGRMVQIKLQLKARRYRIAMQEGRNAIGRRDWQMALTWFGRARDLNPGTVEAEGAVRFTTCIIRQIEDTRHCIARAITEGDRNQAMALARKLDDYLDRIAREPGQSGGHPS